MKDRYAYLLMFVSIPVLWILIVAIFSPKPFLFPPLNLVADVLWEDRASIASHTLATLKIAVLGFALANLIAIGLAISFLYIPILESFLTPWSVLIKNLPLPVYASILVVVLGDTPLPKIIVVILFNFFPILANMSKGLKSADTVLIDRLRSLNASKWQIFVKARWPAALPYYIAAQEIAFTGGLIAAIVAEWFFSQEGLGYLLVQSSTEYRTDRLYAVALLSSVLAISSFLLVRFAESWAFRWKKDMHS